MPPKKFQRDKFDARTIGSRCDECPLKDRKPVLPERAKSGHPKLILLGEAPGTDENYLGSPFAGRGGEYLEDELTKAGLRREDCHTTTAILCQPTGKKFKDKDWKQAIRCCAPRLEAELADTGCTTVLALGDKAYKAVTGKSDAVFHWAGYPLPGSQLAFIETVDEPSVRSGDGPDNEAHVEKPKAKTGSKKRAQVTTFTVDYSRYTVIPNQHPMFAAFYKPALKPVFSTILNRAAHVSNGSFKPWVWPDFVLSHEDARTESILQDLLTSGLPVALDIENIPDQDIITALGLSNGRATISLPFDDYKAGPHGQVNGRDSDHKLSSLYARFVLPILSSPIIEKVAHNGAHDLAILKTKGIVINNFTADTMLSHAVVCQQLSHGLAFACMMEFPAPRWKAEWGALDDDAKGDDKWVKRDPLALRNYNARDAHMTALLWQAHKKRLDAFPHGWNLFNTYMRMLTIAMKMKERGFQIDRSVVALHIARLKPEQAKQVELLQAAALRLGMKDFNHRSSKQVKELFLDKLGCSVLKRSEITEEASFDEETLSQYRTYPDGRVQFMADNILKVRSIDKLLNTYLENLILDELDRVHSTPNVHGALTGRWSFKNPSIQVIPKPVYGKDADGKKIVVTPGMRDMFVASPGMFLVKADYSQLELRIVAILSNATKLLRWYQEGADVHTLNAKAIFGDSFESHLRNVAKGYIFGKIYGANDETIYLLLRKNFPMITLEMIRFISESWQREHPEIFTHQAEVIRDAQVNHYVEAPLSGRRRYFFDKVSPTEAPNHPIQGTGADVICAAMEGIDSELGDWSEGGILAQVHDELVLEHKDPVFAFNLLHKWMEAPVQLNGGSHILPIEVSIGLDWQNMIDVKNEEEVLAAVKKLRGE